MPRAHQHHRPEAKGPGGAISRGTRHGLAVARAKRQARLRVVPSEVLRFGENGLLGASMRMHAEAAAEESLGIAQALGGVERLSEQRLLAVQDLGRLGVVLRSLLAMFLEKPDAELGTRVSTIVGQRRALLALIGMERLESDAPSLAKYLEQHRATPVHRTNAPPRQGARTDLASTEARSQGDAADLLDPVAGTDTAEIVAENESSKAEEDEEQRYA